MTILERSSAFDLEPDGTVGNEALIQRSKRHWRCREVAWLRFGIADPWADSVQFPHKTFFEMFKVPVEAGLRLTAYRNFHNRDTELQLVDYDLIVIRTPKGPVVHQYENHDAITQANAAAIEILKRIDEWYDADPLLGESAEASTDPVEDPKSEK